MLIDIDTIDTNVKAIYQTMIKYKYIPRAVIMLGIDWRSKYDRKIKRSRKNAKSA